MTEKKKRIGLLTSGGDSPGMNAAIRAVVRCGIENGFEVYGIYRGFEGLLDGDMKRMQRRSVGDIMQRGGTILRTARSKRFNSEEGVDAAVKILKENEIDDLIIIGGNGSMNGAVDLSKKGINVLGIPGTIDNDLAYTDFTIGFETAVSTVLDAISKIRDTSSSHERITVIEVMGRDCGDIALYSGLTGGAESVLVPEMDYDVNEIAEKTLKGIKGGKLHSIILRAEGAKITSQELVETLEKNTGRETKLVVLSYLQRGGSPTMRDRLLATNCGSKAIELIKEGIANVAIGTRGGKTICEDIGNATKKKHVLRKDMYDLIDVLSK